MSRPLAALAVLLALALAAAFTGCGSSKSTAPYGGGGGGGGGPSFNLTFPARGASSSFTFADSGSWAYHCAVHQGMGMTGVVNVTFTGADSDTVDVGVDGTGSNAFVFTPSTVSVKRGGTVRWINRSSLTSHTVTRP